MEYGITFALDGVAEQPSPLKYLTHFAREAAQMGWTYGVIGDRLESGLDPFVLLTAIAEASGRMRLVTSVVILPPRGILVTAKQYAALDVLSGGRVIAGVGTGSLFRDYDIVGMDHRDMWPRFEEGVQALRAYLTHEAPPWQGKFYDTTGVNLEPKPVQRPGLTLWIGSWGSNAGLRRVARLADGWLSSAGPGHQSPEQFVEDVKRLNVFLVQEGKDPATFPSAVSTMALFISEDRDELAHFGGPGYPGYVPRPAGVGVAQPAGRPLEEAHAHDMVGTRAECLDKVRRWQAAGVGALFFVLRGPDPLGQMRIFMHDVASQA
jgi:alkanesulfonate monooxygenase SsuD/methylene tetrahydromethanopterin reductase-like flavin-dependent oxidoreductase (luciferase family)